MLGKSHVTMFSCNIDRKWRNYFFQIKCKTRLANALRHVEERFSKKGVWTGNSEFITDIL